MPNCFLPSNHASESPQEMVGQEDSVLREASPPKRRASLMGRLGGLLRRHHGEQQAEADVGSGGVLQEHVAASGPSELDVDAMFPVVKKESSSTRSTKAVPSLPRPQTFRRQQSEKRDRLLEIPPERRAVSLDRRQRGFSASAARRPLSPKPLHISALSAPDIGNADEQPSLSPVREFFQEANDAVGGDLDRHHGCSGSNDVPYNLDDQQQLFNDDFEPHPDHETFHHEYENRWILNLSMHFRDKSNREKFFVTYAETANTWRRVTVSLDYRDALPGSLEEDMSTLHYQRDKSFRIYEAIHESLPDIQYYNTVTNLKLTTEREDGQLHIHVREDANETIKFPPDSLFKHVRCKRFREKELEFDSHISGFVYRVHVDNQLLVKKEIPGPDTIDEFFYEVNALDSLLGCESVTQLRGLVTDDSGNLVKGLLISYASQGALVDMLYDYAGTPDLHWPRREKWARQIVQGLSKIHEAGFVQGDFTLSNIVIDDRDNAQIIDINRRGCPVGWEPAELGRLIDSGQRIGMHIGVKTDLFQMGMVLWALAEEVDEPEREERPLPRLRNSIPRYFHDIVEKCLCDQPQGRWSAARLLPLFPRNAGYETEMKLLENSHSQLKTSDHSISTHRSDKEYIDPAMAVTIDEVAEQRRRRADTNQSHFTSGQVTYVDPPSGQLENGQPTDDDHIEQARAQGFAWARNTPGAQGSDLTLNAPPHQDSGFDEKMIESLELANPFESTYYEAPAVHEMPVVDEALTSTPAQPEKTRPFQQSFSTQIEFKDTRTSDGTPEAIGETPAPPAALTGRFPAEKPAPSREPPASRESGTLPSLAPAAGKGSFQQEPTPETPDTTISHDNSSTEKDRNDEAHESRPAGESIGAS
ncbi:hypothetical protein MBLNU230_g5618t1 [Neophaeotheca triangularis]